MFSCRYVLLGVSLLSYLNNHSNQRDAAQDGLCLLYLIHSTKLMSWVLNWYLWLYFFIVVLYV